MRQSVWDVTSLVQQLGGGSYRVADIPNESFSSWTPWAAWSIVAVYQWDDSSGEDFFELSEAEQYRFIPRSIAWEDGNQYRLGGQNTSVTAGPLVTPDQGQDRFGKTFHQVAHANINYVDSARVNNQPHGDNNLVNNSPAPVGVSLGGDPDCNSTRDVQNETICYLGNKVTDSAIPRSGYLKQPGGNYTLSNNNTRPENNSSSYDADVIRMPDTAITSGTTQVTYDVVPGGSEWLNVGMVGVSIDLPFPRPVLNKTAKKIGDGPIRPGDTIEYTLTAQNTGKDIAIDSLVTDQLPAGMTYVSGSASVTAGFNQGRKTDASNDNDGFNFSNGTLRACLRWRV